MRPCGNRWSGQEGGFFHPNDGLAGLAQAHVVAQDGAAAACQELTARDLVRVERVARKIHRNLLFSSRSVERPFGACNSANSPRGGGRLICSLVGYFMGALAHQVIWMRVQLGQPEHGRWRRATRPAPPVKGSPETSPEVQGFLPWAQRSRTSGGGRRRLSRCRLTARRRGPGG